MSVKKGKLKRLVWDAIKHEESTMHMFLPKRRCRDDSVQDLIHYLKELLEAKTKNHGRPFGITKKRRLMHLTKRVEDLYHCTSKRAAKLIKTGGGVMTRGSAGLAGGGIYFACSKESANRKALHTGQTLLCRVKLGRCLVISKNGDPDINFRDLLEIGYDSVCIPRTNGTEYVVYNSDQVQIISYTGNPPTTHPKSTNATPNHTTAPAPAPAKYVATAKPTIAAAAAAAAAEPTTETRFAWGTKSDVSVSTAAAAPATYSELARYKPATGPSVEREKAERANEFPKGVGLSSDEFFAAQQDLPGRASLWQTTDISCVIL